jgi:hypothetical protein
MMLKRHSSKTLISTTRESIGQVQMIMAYATYLFITRWWIQGITITGRERLVALGLVA